MSLNNHHASSSTSSSSFIDLTNDDNNNKKKHEDSSNESDDKLSIESLDDLSIDYDDDDDDDTSFRKALNDFDIAWTDATTSTTTTTTTTSSSSSTKQQQQQQDKTTTTPKQTTTTTTTSTTTTIEEDPDYTNDKICPICFEEKTTIRPIPHWTTTNTGNISQHKMCDDCRSLYTKNECPFCNEVSIKENLLAVISCFIHDIKEGSVHGDPNDLASMMEMWQFFEMEYGSSNPKVVYRVGKLIVEDEEFKSLLQKGVEDGSEWMRDAAGIIFRLYSLSEQGRIPTTTDGSSSSSNSQGGGLDVTDDTRKLLQDCYDTILKVLMSGRRSHGHFLGAVYNQALVAYVCALRTGQETTKMGEVAREIGRLVIRIFHGLKSSRPELKQEIPERIIEEYMVLASDSLWGGVSKDPIRATFY